MRKNIFISVSTIVLLCFAGCSQEKKVKDRTQADEMFERICKLTEEYTDKLESAPDSVDWASVCNEFEEKLDKITFSYPPDTDLLLTEGQNDTINILMQEYVKMRGRRIHGLLHPQEEAQLDSISDSDSLKTEEKLQSATGD